jgi:hypothetical protein
MRLGSVEQRVLCAAFDALIPPGEDARLPLGARDVPLHRFLDDLLERAPLHFAAGLRVVALLLLVCPPFVIGRLASFLGLEPRARLSVLLRLQQSPIYVVREVPLLLKTVACLGYCGLPEVQARLGIAPRDASRPGWAATDPDEPG